MENKRLDSAAQSVHSPLLRNAVHASAFFLCIIPLGALADPRTKTSCGATVVIGTLLFIAAFNVLVLPRLESGRRIRRPGESVFGGILLYPLTLALCFAVYPAFAAMAAWAAMAGGDAAASCAGRIFPRPRLPWNPNKSWAGLLAFVLCALPCCLLALWWCPCPLFLTRMLNPETPFVWTLAVLAAFAGAILESLPRPFDDNVRVPLGVGLILAVSALFLSWATRGLPAETHVQPGQFLNALAVNAVLAAAVLLLRFADIPGTLLGAAIGAAVYFFAHWEGYALFLLFVGMGSGLSKFGFAAKAARGAAEAREGRRGIGNVAANLAVPALCCLAYPAQGGHPAFLIAFAGALAAALADTASSEIGALASRPPVLITTWRPAAHGTNGAVTVLGFGAAALASVLIAGAAWAIGFFQLACSQTLAQSFQSELFAAVAAAGMTGTVFDSLLGATVEDRVPGVGKGAVNFACTLAGAGVAGALSILIVPK